MRALGFEPKKEEIKKMIADIDKEGTGKLLISMCVESMQCVDIVSLETGFCQCKYVCMESTL